MEQKIISIIIPAYNRASTLHQCISSLIGQSYKAWECIIVDDFSKDGTSDLVNDLQSRDSRIRYVLNQRSKGSQGARNTGIQHSKTEWIAFNDSDDEWVPNKLELQVKALATNNFNPYTVVHGDCIINNHSNNTEIIWNLPIVEGEKPFDTLLKQPSPVFPTLLTSKKALVEVGLLDENVPSYQEWDTALLLSRVCSFIHIREPLFVYHLHGGDTISKSKKRAIEGYHYILLKYRQDIIGRFGQQFFTDVILDNIKKIVLCNEWTYGMQLLKDAKPYIPLKSFLYYMSCFKFQVAPDKLRLYSRRETSLKDL